MSPANFDSRAMDLSGLAAAAQPPTGASYVVEADDRTFNNAVSASMKHPVVIEFYSPRANAQQLSDDLASLANAAGGKYLLVRVNVDESRQVAQTLGVQAVPMVVGAVGGQLVPLFQGTADSADVAAALDQLVQASVANGIVGRAEPVAGGQGADAEAEAGPDPRFAEADAAMQEGDFDRAIAEFDKLLAENPADAEAKTGKLGAQLLQRLGDKDPAVVAAAATAHPEDVGAQLDAADFEVVGGQPEAAFARLIQLVRERAGDDRERARVRLLELFEIIGGTDPAVLKARRELMTALF